MSLTLSPHLARNLALRLVYFCPAPACGSSTVPYRTVPYHTLPFLFPFAGPQVPDCASHLSRISHHMYRQIPLASLFSLLSLSTPGSWCPLLPQPVVTSTPLAPQPSWCYSLLSFPVLVLSSPYRTVSCSLTCLPLAARLQTYKVAMPSHSWQLSDLCPSLPSSPSFFTRSYNLLSFST